MILASVTDLPLQDRLRPLVSRGVSESDPASGPVKPHRLPASTMKARLSRSTSLDRIRQFPAYCFRGCLPHALSYLQTSSSAIQAGLPLVRNFLLIVAVYLSLVFLTLQLSACCWALLVGTTPPGLVFMVASLFAMCYVACKIIAHDYSK